MKELERANEDHLTQFIKVWESAMSDLEENFKGIALELEETHQRELEIFDEEVDKVQIPKVKYSREVLDLRILFQKMLKAKK